MVRRQGGTRAVAGIAAGLLVAAFGLASGEAAEIQGQLRYMDTNGTVPIRRARVEIWYRDVNWWDVWAVIGLTRTRNDGTVSFKDDRARGTYALRVFAENEAAIVWPRNLHDHAYSVDPGAPLFDMQLSPTSSSSILDFSWTFTDLFIAEHFNIAETVLIGRDYAVARRDSSETDQLTQVNVQPMLAGWTYYDSVVNQIFIESPYSMRDAMILHEYGHAVHAHLGHQTRIPSYHGACEAYTYQGGVLINSEEHAFMEAFASFFAAAVMRTAPPGSSLERAVSGTLAARLLEWPSPCSSTLGLKSYWGTGFPVTPVTPSMIEGLVGATLWDLFDPLGHPEQGLESHDTIAGEDSTILEIIDRELDVSTAPTIFMFRTAWGNRGKDIAGLDCILSAHGILPERPGCRRSAAVKLVGHFNADNRSDIALTGAAGWGSIPVAFSNGDGSFNVTNSPDNGLAAIAARPGVAKLTGDFNSDGLTDIAFVIPGIDSITVGLSDGSGSFSMPTNIESLPEFGALSGDPTSESLAGDFDGDGDTDIALVGRSPSLPIAWSDGHGQFFETLVPTDPHFALMASHVRSIKLVGEFNGRPGDDILILGVPGVRYLPVMYSHGHGTFDSANVDAGDFAIWATTPGVKILSGDFNGDRITDVALTGVAGWNTVPLFLMGGSGVLNVPVGSFAGWSSSPAAKHLVGDFSGYGRAGIALTGVAGWATLPLALSDGWNFGIVNPPAVDFAAWSTSAGAEALVGDFNGDGKSDVALTGVAGWTTVPIAFANVQQTVIPFSIAVQETNMSWVPNVTFTVTNRPIGDFALWTTAR